MTPLIRSSQDACQLVNKMGFLPFFAGEVPNFSIEEATHSDYWFPEGIAQGVWEWKGDIILNGYCAYGKFYQSKACFISAEWFPHFVNYRRSAYAITPAEQGLLETIKAHKSLLSSELKKLCGYTTPRNKRENAPKKSTQRKQSFDTAITHLQMAGQIITVDFEYSFDRLGNKYGWGVARYCTPEEFFGSEAMETHCTSEESKQKLIDFLTDQLPQATPEQISRIVG